MKNRNLIIIGLVILGSVGLILFTKPAPDGPAGYRTAEVSSAFSSEETSFDFGTVSMAEGNVSHVFRVRNAGEAAEKITKAYTSCMCTTAVITDEAGRNLGSFGMPGHGFVPRISKELLPGEELTVEVVFDPAAHGPAGVGPIQRQVYIESNSGPLAVFQIKALVTP